MPHVFVVQVDDKGVSSVFGADVEPVSDRVARGLAIGMYSQFGPRGYVYFALRQDDELVKIGMSKNTGRRGDELWRDVGGRIIHRVPCSVNNMRATEYELHRFFEDFRRDGEWFLIDSIMFQILRGFQSGRELRRWLMTCNGQSALRDMKQRLS